MPISGFSFNQFMDGAAHRLQTIIEYPRNAVKYSLGADRVWGEDNDFLQNSGLHYGPGLDPLFRISSIFNRLLPHPNLPQNDYEWGQLSFSAFTVALGFWLTNVAVIPFVKEVIHYRALDQLLKEVSNSTRVGRLEWIVTSGEGRTADAIAELKQLAEALASPADKTFAADMVEGNRAMAVLGRLAATDPKIHKWLQQPVLAATFADALNSNYADLSRGALQRLWVMLPLAPAHVITSLADSVLADVRDIVLYEDNSGMLRDRSAHSQFALLSEFERYPTLQPLVREAYARILRGSLHLPIVHAAVAGLMRQLPTSLDEFRKIFSDPVSIESVYATTYAVLKSPLQDATIQKFLKEMISADSFMGLMGRETTPSSVLSLGHDLAVLGNASGLTLLQNVVAQGRIVAPMALRFLYQLMVVPAYVQAVTDFVQGLNVQLIESRMRDALLSHDDNMGWDPAHARQNAELLLELVKAHNPQALTTLLNCSQDADPALVDLTAQQLVKLVLDGTIDNELFKAMLRVPVPRTIALLKHWVRESGSTVQLDLSGFTAVMMMPDAVLTADVLSILKEQATHSHNPVAVNLVSRLLAKASVHDTEKLVEILISAPMGPSNVEWSSVAQAAQKMAKAEPVLSVKLLHLLADHAGATAAGHLVAQDLTGFVAAALENNPASLDALALLAKHGHAAAQHELEKIASDNHHPLSGVAQRQYNDVPQAIQPLEQCPHDGEVRAVGALFAAVTFEYGNLQQVMRQLLGDLVSSDEILKDYLDGKGDPQVNIRITERLIVSGHPEAIALLRDKGLFLGSSEAAFLTRMTESGHNDTLRDFLFKGK